MSNSSTPRADHPWRARIHPQRSVFTRAPRTVRDELIDREIEEVTRREQVRYGDRFEDVPTRRDPTYEPLAGEGSAVRKSVRYDE